MWRERGGLSFITLLGEAWGEFADKFPVRLVESGSLIFTRGEVGDRVYVVARGHVLLFVETTLGDEVEVEVAGAGEVIGEGGCLEGGSRPMSARAIDEVVVWELGPEAVMTLFRAHPEAALGCLAVANTRVRRVADVIHASGRPESEEEEGTARTLGERVADRVAAFGGSWKFIMLFGGVILVWMALNLLFLTLPFDPYPFILLNLVLSCLAALQAPVIMMSQNRQAHTDRRRADLDYRVNLRAGREVAQLHAKMDRVHRDLQLHIRQAVAELGARGEGGVRADS